MRLRTARQVRRTPVRVAVVERTGPPALGLKAPALTAAQDPQNLRVPQLYTSATTALGPAARRRSPAEFPPPYPNSQPVSFLISSSSSSRSNVEARDPITEPEAPPGAGAPEATAATGEREGREERPGVKKEEGSSVTTADRGGNPGWCAEEGGPEGGQSEARQRPAQQQTSALPAPALNESAKLLGESR